MTPSPENPSTRNTSNEDRILKLIDRLGSCTVKYIEYQAKRDLIRLGLLLSLMISSWLSVGILLFIAFTPFLGPILFEFHSKPEVRPVEPPSEPHYESQPAPAARNAA